MAQVPIDFADEKVVLTGFMNSETIICRHCGGSVNAGSRVCPLCGGERPRELTQVRLQCPRCRCLLETNTIRDTLLDHCPQCNGLWLGLDAFARLSSERDVFQDQSVPYTYERKALPQVEGYLPCARCGKLMTRLNFRTISGVMIDYCRDCGYWLDAGELEQIRAFVANGGTDKLHDREIENNRREIGRVSDRVDDLEFREQVVHARNALYWISRLFF